MKEYGKFNKSFNKIKKEGFYLFLFILFILFILYIFVFLKN